LKQILTFSDISSNRLFCSVTAKGRE